MPTLDWIGKQAVVNHHLEVPYRLLKCDASLSAGDPEAGNLLVQGDNLLALKALLPYYAGQVGCIYIDPPYNTGNEGWVYNDSVNSPEIESWLINLSEVRADDLSKHDKWLCMMYPRLHLLRQFLCDDGFIFISIDDNEYVNLIYICDEIFGENKHLATIVRRRRQSQANLSKNISTIHEYVVCYAMNVRSELNKIKPKIDYATFQNPDNDPRGLYVTMPCTNKGGSRYTIVTPTGNKYDDEWRFKAETYQSLLKDNRLVFPRSGNGKPRYKLFLNERISKGIIPNSWWEDIASNQEGSSELKEIFNGDIVFNNPKPVELIKQLILLGTKRDSLVLDSFSGSGTTGHAVLQLNKEDSGNRRFILVEMEEAICQNVTAERLKRVINGYGDKEGLGGGFRYCKLGEPLFDEYGNIRDDVKFNDLAHHIFFSETGLPLPKNAKRDSPLIGIHEGKAYYLLFNGILGDKSINGGNILTSKILVRLPAHNGPKIIFGEGTRIGLTRLRKENITFKQIPYEIKTN